MAAVCGDRAGIGRVALDNRMRLLSGGACVRRAAPVRSTILLFLALALSACARRGGDTPYGGQGFGIPSRATVVEPGYDVPVGPLDVLKIDVFRVPDLSGEYQVDARGFINLPLIGPVNVRDQNAEQLSASLTRLYNERYLNNPSITIRVVTSNQNNITVEGGVNYPGIFPLAGRTTLAGAIALARGINVNDGNPKRIVIFRRIEGKVHAAAFDMISIRRGKMDDPVVFPGDVIVIDSSQTRALYRDLIQSIPIVALFTRL